VRRADQPTTTTPRQRPARTARVCELTPAEVRYFWSFHDGSIMCVDIRERLYKSWGFCPRHTWAMAVTEPEYRTTLHGTAILYEDLTGHAVRALRLPSLTHGAQAKRLRARAGCSCCEFLGVASRAGAKTDSKTAGILKRVNRRQRFDGLLVASRPVWWARTCPICLGGDGPLCRQHILSGVSPPPGLADELERIRLGLRALADSMRWQGAPADDGARASWVEALGWFAGWQFPAAVLGLPEAGTGQQRAGQQRAVLGLPEARAGQQRAGQQRAGGAA
jgi:hypothetical protein